MSFGDKDPEDAYDTGDPPARNLGILEPVIDDLAADQTDPRFPYRRDDALRLVLNLERRPGVDLLRLRAIRDTLEAL